MDFFVSYMGMSSWRLFPPSYYYRYTPEELEQMKVELREKIEKIFDEWDREEQEEKQKLELQSTGHCIRDEAIKALWKKEFLEERVTRISDQMR